MRLLGRFVTSLPEVARRALGAFAAAGRSAVLAVASVLVVLSVAGAVAGAGGEAALAAAVNPPGDTVASVVPSTAAPGSRVTFAVSCASLDATSATLFGQTLGLPEQIPMDAGAADGDFTITVTLPSDIQPATYHPAIQCSDGTSANATLLVSPFPAAGGAQTGDGTTSTTTNTGLATGGLVLIAVGAIAGGIAMRRRGSGNSGTQS